MYGSGKLKGKLLKKKMDSDEDSDTIAVSSTEEDFYVEDNSDGDDEPNFFEENIETVNILIA